MGPILALDCGGSRTSALLFDSDGRVLRSLSGGPANLRTAGANAVAKVVRDLVADAPETKRLALGVAGLRTGEEAAELLDALGHMGVRLPSALYSDLQIALRAGTEGDGIVVVAGTGVAAYGRAGMREARAGGWGSALGDEGGAYWMVSSLLRAALRALDEGDQDGAAILDAMLAQAREDDAGALRHLAAGPDGVARLAALLPAAVRLWEDGNAIAYSLLDRSATEIGRLAAIVSRRLGLAPGYPLLLTGGMVAAFPDLVSAVQHSWAGAAQVDVLRRDPAWGAYLLALDDDSWATPPAPATPATERPNPRTGVIGRLTTPDLLTVMNREDANVPAAVAACIPDLARLVDRTVDSMRRGGRLLYLGAGTSGRLAMLDAVECVPTFGVDPGRVVALVAGGADALTRAVEGAEDDESAGRDSVIAAGVSDVDTVVGVSASGGARYVLGGLEQSRERGATTALVTCNPEADSLPRWDFGVVAVVGPEVIAGSSRLKAGTAQKLVLNMLSTATMIRLGRTAGNRMIGLRPTNAKLQRRAIRLTAELSETSPEEARSVLEKQGWDVTRAVLVLRTGDPIRADALLVEADGDLERALQLSE